MAEEKEVVVEEAQAEATEAKKPSAPRGDRRPHGDKKGDRKGPRRTERPVKEYEERVVAINRISKTVKGGRRMRFSAIVVIGDGKGKFGYGCGKAAEVPDAIKKALEAAKKNMYNVPMVKGGTVPHGVEGTFGATKVFLKPAPEGTGIIAGGPVRAILELAGVKNIYSKVYGARAPINILRATTEGLKQLKTYAQVKAIRNI